jgi:hypothetical protein
MPEWKAVKNITLFAEEVIPRMRARGSAGRAPDTVATVGR